MEAGTVDWGIIGFAVSIVSLLITIVALFAGRSSDKKDKSYSS